MTAAVEYESSGLWHGNVPVTDWRTIRMWVLARDEYLCQTCRVATANEVDHVWPRRLGGSDNIANLKAICGSCNKIKGARVDLSAASDLQLYDAKHTLAARIEVLERDLESIRAELVVRRLKSGQYLLARLELASDLARTAASAEALKAVIQALLALFDPPHGLVVVPGIDHYAYEPHRLVTDDQGDVVCNADARLQHKISESRRSMDDLAAMRRQARVQREADHFSDWALAQLANGRHPRELTWDTCVRETGLWKDADPEPAGTDPDDESEVAA